MLKIAMIVAGVLAIAGIGWPIISGVIDGGPNEATKLVEATERTNNKAGNLNESFTDIIPPAPASRNTMPPSITAPFAASPQPGTAPGTGAPGAEAPGAGAPGITPDPTAGAQPDRYAAYVHPSEHAVSDAMEYLHRLQTELNPTPTQYIQAVEQLQRAWNPRYIRAVEEYKRFAYRIDRADAMAGEYFQVQESLTKQISNPRDRQRAVGIDAAEREVYLDWRDQAFRTLGQAQTIMMDLHDMNVIITKQSLSAHFASLYDEFHTIPPAITILHEELARFREESERIQTTFGVNGGP